MRLHRLELRFRESQFDSTGAVPATAPCLTEGLKPQLLLAELQPTSLYFLRNEVAAIPAVVLGPIDEPVGP